MTAASAPPEPGPRFDAPAIIAATRRIRETVTAVARDGGARGVAFGQVRGTGAAAPLAILPPLYPEWLGDRAFTERQGIRFPYIVGEMARGISGVEMVIAAARAGLLGCFGAAGLSIAEVDDAIGRIAAALDREATTGRWGVNIIHQPGAPAQEQALVDLLIARGVRCASASAFMQVGDALVHYACAGLHRDAAGRVARRHRLLPKISRPEVARGFIAPAPAAALQRLVAAGRLTAAEADLARTVPLADTITVEADSGGHTDRRPLVAMLPAIRDLAEDAARRHGYDLAICIGAAGGIGTPGAAAAAFAMGAAFVLTGSINQATREAAVSDDARALLGEAGIADFAMAPSADMFEIGASVQVLQRGTLFPQRAARLLTLYRDHEAIEALPAPVCAQIEEEIFRMPLAQVWALTRAHLAERSPETLARAEREPRVRMAMVFRWYLGLASRWPLEGQVERRSDYQLWAGPALGACNDWLRGSPLEDVRRRGVAALAYNILEGAAVLTRAQQLRAIGVAVPAAAFRVAPHAFR